MNVKKKHFMKENERKKMFLNRDDMRTYYLYTFCFLPDYAEKKYTKYCIEKKVAYNSCYIAFEMNSCEFARTYTTDVHSTTILCKAPQKNIIITSI